MGEGSTQGRSWPFPLKGVFRGAKKPGDLKPEGFFGPSIFFPGGRGGGGGQKGGRGGGLKKRGRGFWPGGGPDPREKPPWGTKIFHETSRNFFSSGKFSWRGARKQRGRSGDGGRGPPGKNPKRKHWRKKTPPAKLWRGGFGGGGGGGAVENFFFRVSWAGGGGRRSPKGGGGGGGARKPGEMEPLFCLSGGPGGRGKKQGCLGKKQPGANGENPSFGGEKGVGPFFPRGDGTNGFTGALLKGQTKARGPGRTGGGGPENFSRAVVFFKKGGQGAFRARREPHMWGHGGPKRKRGKHHWCFFRGRIPVVLNFPWGSNPFYPRTPANHLRLPGQGGKKTQTGGSFFHFFQPRPPKKTNLDQRKIFPSGASNQTHFFFQDPGRKVFAGGVWQNLFSGGSVFQKKPLGLQTIIPSRGKTGQKTSTELNVCFFQGAAGGGRGPKTFDRTAGDGRDVLLE